MIYALFRVHAPFTVIVSYRLCSLEASQAGGEGCFSREVEVIFFAHILCYVERHIFLTLSSSVWFEIDALLEEMAT